MDNNKIIVTFLGTGTSTGVPVIGCDCPICTSSDTRDKRFRTSAMIEVNNKRIIIDCGPDFRFQMLRNKVDDIDALFFTHGHRDHIAGIDDVRGFNYIHNKHIEVYASSTVVDSIKTEFPYIFNTKGYLGAPRLNIHEITNEPFDFEGIKITPIKVMHQKMEVFGYRIYDFTYITDANYISDEELKKIFGSKVLVINALRNSKHISHYSLSEAIEIADYVKVKKTYFTHMSHWIGLHKDVEEGLPEKYRLAYDDLKIEIDI